MRKLDKKKKYDLRGLSKKQFRQIQAQFNKQGGWNVLSFSLKEPYLSVYFNEEIQRWVQDVDSDEIGVDALTLFEPKLKIGDTFEYNGFVCEVKEKIEEKKWYRIIDRIGNLYFEKMPKERAEQAVNYEVKSIIEITNKEFIKQLEENAR